MINVLAKKIPVSKKLNCSSCASSQVEHNLKYQEYNIWQCSNCNGLTYEIDKSINFKDLYGKSYFRGGEYTDYEAHQEAHKQNAHKKWKKIRPFLSQAPSVLEIGCAYGYFKGYLEEQGIESYFGLDISENAISSALANYGPHFSTQAPPQNFNYNCIVMWDVWEHLENPQLIIERYFSKLPKNGVVALTTVDSSSVVARVRGPKWRQIHPPTHLHYPTFKALRTQFEKLNFEIIDHSHISVSRAFEVYLESLNFNLKLMPESIRRLPISCNLYDTQFILASKKSD